MTMRLGRIAKTLLATVLCVLAVTLASPAQQQQQSYRVKSGDTLFSIARQFNVTVQDLRDWNSLEGNKLEVGRSLRVSAPQGGEEAVTHTVQAQETLFSISKQYGVSISEIKSWNDLSDNALEVGQELTIYQNGEEDNGQDSNESIVVNSTTQQNTYYTVKSGDTLYRIATEHGMTVDELKELNDLTSNNIAVGQQLTVRKTAAPPSVAGVSAESTPQGKFITHTVSGTQTVDEILNIYKMDRTEFEALNPDIGSTTFNPGQKLTVLAPPTRQYANPYTAEADLTNLGETPVSRYSESEKGKSTTSGELYNPAELTAAHSNISLGTVLFIQNPANGKGVYVRINDRISGNGLKLSDAAWQSLNFSGANPMVKIYQDQ